MSAGVGLGPLLWTLAFLALAAAVLVAPFVPALLEWRWPSDVGALPVVREHDDNARAFATGFAALLQEAGALPRLAASAARRSNADAVTLHGVPFLLLGQPAAWDGALAPGCEITAGLLAAGDLQLPDRTVCRREIYGSAAVRLGAGARARAVLAQGELSLAPGAGIWRWADAGGRLLATQDAHLPGRATSQRAILLERGVRFCRLQAPVILAGRPLPRLRGPRQELCPWKPDGEALDREGRVLHVEGDVRIPSGSRVEHHLVVTGSLHIGADSRIAGSVKACGDLRLGERVRVDGALVSEGDLTIGPRCRLAGPVIAEGLLTLGEGSRIGGPRRPTTVTAERMRWHLGALTHGSVRARNDSRVQGSLS